jgi:hypothetical protein
MEGPRMLPPWTHAGSESDCQWAQMSRWAYYSNGASVGTVTVLRLGLAGDLAHVLMTRGRPFKRASAG